MPGKKIKLVKSDSKTFSNLNLLIQELELAYNLAPVLPKEQIMDLQKKLLQLAQDMDSNASSG